MRDNELWLFILERIEKSHSVILLCVVDSKGSSPGRQGFKMAVASDKITGSIGGGIMEHKFVEMAREKLRAIPDDPIIRKQVHSKSAKQNQSGMICSGEQTIALFHITKSHVSEIEKIVKALQRNNKGLIRISENNISYENKSNSTDFHFEIKSESDWFYEENLGYKNHLFIIGGGHCALALSRLMSTMDFSIHVFEERKDLNTLDKNSFAHEKTLVKDYSELKKLIPSGNNNYVVIMTFGYRTDDLALRSLINKEFKYIGMLGSQSKMDKMFSEWRNDNLPEDKLKVIHAPIGLKINSRIPEEIAVSIGAEIIAVKNK
jgi:xanthine dehydrogenase accessory factor